MPLPVQAGRVALRRRFQRGTLIIRGKVPTRCAVYRTILLVTSVLGLRIGEALALRIADIDFKRKIVRVRQSLDSATRTIQAVKSQASSADVPLPSVLEARLRAHFRKHEGKSELLFVNRAGRPLSANKLREKQLHPLLEKLGMP